MRRIAYWMLRAASGVRHRLERRCTRAGLLAVGVAVASAGVGIDTNVTLAYQVFCFAAALLLVAVIGASTFRGRFEARRVLPDFATVGESVRYRIEVVNRAAQPAPALSALETLRDPRPDWPAFAAARGAVLDAWRRSSRRAAADAPQPIELPAIAPGERTSALAEVLPLRRGAIEFEAVTLARPDPLGLVRGFARAEAASSLLVLPKRYLVPELTLPGFRRYQPGGVTLASSVGDSEEFLGLRDYREGDPLQRIHWKSFARAGKPVVREYQDEFFERHALVLDTFSGDETLVEEAISVAASFACTVETRDSLLDLLFVDGESYCYTLGRGQHQVEDLLEVLAHVSAGVADEFAALRESVLERRAGMSGAIAVLVAWDESRRAFVEALQETGLPVTAYVVSRDAPVAAGENHPGWLVHLEPGRIEEGLAAS